MSESNRTGSVRNSSDLSVDSDAHYELGEEIQRFPKQSAWIKYKFIIQSCGFILFTAMIIIIGSIIVSIALSRRPKRSCLMLFQRTTKPIITYDSHSRHVIMGDFNKDTYLDMAVVNTDTDNIGIRLGSFNGSFGSERKYFTGYQSHPYWAAIGDFNNDNISDIVVANYGIHTLCLFLGFGDGNFSQSISFFLGSSCPVALTIGDLNADDKLDVVVVTNGTFDVLILFGFGNGTFSIAHVYFMGFDSMPCSIILSDFNDDHRLDIVVTNYGTSNIAILLAMTSGTYSIEKHSTGKNSHPCSVATGDFNDDGFIDIATANFGTGTIGIFFGLGNGTFESMKLFSINFDSRPKFVLVNDMNNDQILDIIISDSLTNKILVLKGNGAGDFSVETIYSTGYMSNPSAMALGDVDNDNTTDAIIINTRTNTILVLTSYTVHITESQTRYSTGPSSSPNTVNVGDFNNDQIQDIIVTDGDSNRIGIFIGLGNGTFQNLLTFHLVGEESLPVSTAVGDFNNDGNLDIVLAMFEKNRVEVYLGYGNGSFQYDNIYSVDSETDSYFIGVGTFNKDESLDLVIAYCESNTIGVALGIGDGMFANVKYYSTGNNSCPVYIAIADINYDGLFDLISANYYSGTVSIHIGLENGDFETARYISMNNYYPICVIIENFNKDAYQDMAFAFPDSSNIGVMFGDGNGNFSDMILYSTELESVPYILVANDFNKDNQIDIAVLNSEDATIDIFLGYENGNFGERKTFSINDAKQPYTMATGDFNNDNQMDIVTCNIDSMDFTVLIFSYGHDFENEMMYFQESNNHPVAIVTDDLNGDKKVDAIVANSGNNNIEILIDYNQVLFMNKYTFSTGHNTHPQHIAIVDVNRDNQRDIIVINSWKNDMTIFVGSVTGTFSSWMSYQTGAYTSPNSVAVGDLNDDGWIDTVIANKDADNIGIFFGYDYPQFETMPFLSCEHGSHTYFITKGDFNDDSLWDIAGVSRDIPTIDIFLGYGDGQFSTSYSIDLDLDELISPITLASGDFNNDKILDLVVGDSESRNIILLFGHGNGTFDKYRLDSRQSISVVSIVTSDLNNDQILDIIFASADDAKIMVLIGYGNGSFIEGMSHKISIGSCPQCIVARDFNQDNIIDIAAVNQSANNIVIFLGYGNGNFHNPQSYSTGDNSGPRAIDSVDFNNDTFMDMVVLNRQSQNVAILFGYGNGSFSLPITYTTGTTSHATSLLVDDINGDQILDILITDWAKGNGNVIILYGLKNEKFLMPKAYFTGYSSEPSSIITGDFNRDGQKDFAVSDSTKSRVYIMLQNNSEPFGKQMTLLTGSDSSPVSVAVCDLNNDKHLDIAVVNFKASNIGVFIGYGDGNFRTQQIYSTGEYSGPNSIAVGHFNSDQQIDIVVTNSNTNGIAVFFGQRNGSFINACNYSTGQKSEPSFVTVGDLNKDSYMDIVVANRGTNSISIFFGNSEGTFTNTYSYVLDYDSRPMAIAVGDFNNDTWLDIAVANYGFGYVEILLQLCYLPSV